MDLSNYSEFVPEATARNPRKPSNNIFATMKPTSMSFPHSVNRALQGNPKVKVMVNDEEKKFVLVVSDDGKGVTYLKAGRDPKAIVTWHNKDLLAMIKSLLPEDRKENVRIYGKVFDEDGSLGIVFDCTDLGDMRKTSRK